MKEWKAPEKEAQKMTRDGAVSVNLVTGETTYPSDRTPEQDHSASGDTAGAAGKVVDRVELHREQAAAKKKRRKQRRTYREGEAAAGRPSSRLQFSEADQAKPELQGAIRKSDKAADRLDAAKTAVPSKLPSPQHANPLSRPIQEAGAAIHGKVREVEQENSGVQSGHLGERSFEKAVGYGNRRVQNWRAERKLKPWRDAAKAEQAAVKANADFYYRKAVAENPQLASNPISRLWQKRKLQKQYAAAYRAAGKTAQAGKTAETTAKAAKKTAQESKRTALFLKRHWKGALIVGGIGLLLVMLLGSLQSCSSMFGGGVSNIMASSYLSEDADMLAAEEAYCAKEDELREYLDTYEATHDYDEYHFDLDEIEHDPYVLISILSALHEGVFTIDQVQGDLQTLFDKQYILTETVTTETRYRTETRTDSEGNTYTVRVPYTWTICTVTLENFDLSHVPVYMMGEEQLSLYATYMSTLGNRPDLFPSSGYVNKYIDNPPTAWEIPAEYLTDERFNTLITEAEKYLGYVKEIDPGLHALQAEVGGDIAASYPFDDPVGLVLNDEGKLIGLDLNRSLRDEHGEIYDIVAGTFLVVGLGPESFASLPPDMIQKYTEQFKRPELFASINGQIVSVPVEPENPLRTAEMTLEDDYGMIDGIINNGRRGEELEKAQTEARRTTPEKKPSIRERLEDAKRECAERKSPDKPAPQKKPPELGDL